MSGQTAESLFSSIWDGYALAYSRVMPHVSFYAECVDKIAGALDNRFKVLDLGCGPGLITERLSKICDKVIAVDNNPTMVAFARERMRNHANVDILSCDAASLCFGNEIFDAVVCSNVLYSVPEPEKVLKEIYRVLKKDGILLLTGPKPSPDFSLLLEKCESDLKIRNLNVKLSKEFEILKNCNRSIEEKNSGATFTNGQISSMLINTGFSKILESGSCFLSQSYFIKAVR